MRKASRFFVEESEPAFAKELARFTILLASGLFSLR
jgi:hypothetical protein